VWESYQEGWIQSGDLRKGDMVVVSVPKANPQPFDVVLEGCANQHWGGYVRFAADDDFFRLIGYYLADGDSSVRFRRVRLSFEEGKDEKWIEDVQAIAKRLMGLSPTNEHDGKKTAVRINSKSLAKFMAQFGKRRTKGASLEFLSRATDCQIENLLIGMLRGDGHWDGVSVRASWCSPRMASTFMYGCWRLGYTPSVREVPEQNKPDAMVKKSGKQFYMQVGGDDGRRLAGRTWGIKPKAVKTKVGNSKRRWSMFGKVFSRIDEVSREQFKGRVWDMEVMDGESFTLPYVTAHNCGGSLAGAIMIFFCMVYHRKSFIDMAGAGEQAKIVYEYVVGFLGCIPGMKQGLILGDPLLSRTTLKTGVVLKCITNSEKQARGKHLAGFLGDEAAMDDEKSEKAMRAAMQGPLSEPDSIVVLLSTFHVPIGLFQEIWDGSNAIGFGRYRWDVFDAMQKCIAPIDCKKCYLTEKRVEKVHNPHTNKFDEVEVWVGCNGKARKSAGYLTRRMVIEDKKLNIGTTTFDVEFCFLPGTLVLTENGFERIEDIEPGTLVLTHLGRWRRAYPMSRDYSGEIVRMSGQGGMSGELSVGVIPSHPIFHLHGEKTGWMEARHFLNQRYKTYLPCEIERTEPSPLILECLTGGHGKRVPIAKKIERDSGEMAGFLGMTLGDGYIEDRAGVPARVGLVGERDEGIMKDFANLVSVLFDRKAGYKETLTGSVSSFGHKALAEWMKNECGRYAYQKMIPPDFFRSMSEDEDRKFLHYYLDTDGTIGEDAVVFYSTSHGLAGQVYVMLLRNRIPVSVGYYTRKRGGVCGVECDRRPLFHVKVSGPARDRLLRFIGQSCEERDADSHIQAKGDWMVYPRRNAKKEHYSGRVFNLNVEGDDSYCLPSMAVHNCNQRPQ